MLSDFEKFCGDKFWPNSSYLHFTKFPNFTPCFQHTVLIWAPALFFWVLVPIFFLQMSRTRIRKYAELPWSWILCLKMGLTMVLLTDAIFFLVKYFIDDSNNKRLPKADLIFPIVLLFTMTTILLLQYLCKISGIISSGIIHLTFILFSICGLPELYSWIDKLSKNDPDFDLSRCYAYFLWLLCLVLQSIAQCFADPRSETKIEGSSELNSSFMNRITLWWFTPVPVTGAKRDLEVEDLFDLNEGSSSSFLVPMWEKYWGPKVKRYYEKKNYLIKTIKMAEIQPGMTRANIEKLKNELEKLQPPSIVGNMYKIFKYELWTAMGLKLMADTIQFVNPFILHELITYISNPDGELWLGLAYAIGMFAISELRSFLFNHHFYLMFRMSIKIQNILISAVYGKTLKLSNIARKDKTVGEIINLMSIDVERFQTVTPQVQLYWSAPYQCILALAYLYYTIDYAAIPGIVVMVLYIPLNIYCSKWVRGWNTRQMKLKDERSKMINEVLNGIKVVKFYAWEVPMKAMIEKIREKELDCILKSSLVRNMVDIFNWSSPFLVGFLSFFAYTVSDPERHLLTPQIAFVSLTLFNMLRQVMIQVGQMVQQTIQAIVSNNRLKEFLVADELDLDAIHHSIESSPTPIVAKNATFSWDDPETSNPSQNGLLRNINLNISQKNLIAVVGKVGSGKSSLLSALLGEMKKLQGHVKLDGKIAYVPQQAWIQNLTLRDNILFGEPYKKEFYEKVLEACALNPDIAMLPNGDSTEIGEKGINLSGGQKARVSLARAVYQNYDVYLLDDPLSAVDSHVGKHIFEKVLGPNGILRNKTRIFVTHGINYLPKVDLIIHFENGQISDIGTYDQLVSNQEKFSKFITETKTQPDDESSTENTSMSLEDGSISTTSTSYDDPYHKKTLSRQHSTISTLAKRTETSQIWMDLYKETVQKFKDASCLQSPTKTKKLIEKEKVETGRVKMSVYKQYAQSATYLRSFIFLVLYGSYATVQMLRNIWLSSWSDDVDRHPDGHTTLNLGTRLGVYAAYGFGESLTLALSMLALILGGLEASKNLHNPLLFNILRAPMSFFDTTPVGRILNRFGKDIDVCDTALPMNFRYVTMSIVAIFTTFLIIIITNPIFAAVAIPIVGLYFYSMRYYVPTSRQLKRLESTHRSPIYSHFGETIQGASTIRAFGKNDLFVEKCYQKVDAFVRIRYMSVVANRWLAVRTEFIGNGVVLFAALFGVLAHEWGWLSSAGLVGLSVSYALSITNNLNQFTRQLGDLETNIVAVERIKEYARDVPNEASWTSTSTLSLNPSWPNQGQVCFDNYSTRYRPELELVVKNIQATIDPGEKVGIVGRTGAGKSSLTLSLFRIIEASEGRIVIDGVEIGKIGLHDLRSNLTIIPQDPVLFSGSLRFNLDPFDRYTDDEIWLALELAHLKDFTSSLPNGLNYVITEGGENISVGQRQLVCLARALLRRSKILILDEATAAVDLATDTLIQETIRKEFKNSTVITIAHRLNTILDYDRVMVLDQGQIKEFDTPSRLLADQDSMFSNMLKDAKIEKG